MAVLPRLSVTVAVKVTVPEDVAVPDARDREVPLPVPVMEAPLPEITILVIVEPYSSPVYPIYVAVSEL